MTFFDAQSVRHAERRRQRVSPKPYPIFDPVALKSDREPWLLPWNAFTELENCYVRNGRVVKRGGYALLGVLGTSTTESLVVTPGVTSAVSGTLANLPLVPPKGTYKVTFDDGVNFTGATILSATAGDWSVAGASLHVRRESDNASVGLLTVNPDLATFGDYVVSVAAITPSTFGGTPVVVSYEYETGTEVMGLIAYKTLGGNEHLVALDTKRLWEYSVGEERFIERTTSDLWTGANSDFFTFAVFDDELYIANGIDPVQVYDATAGGAPWVAEADTDFDSGSGGNDLDRARIVLAHRRRIVYLDTEENGVDEPHMCRLTAVDDPHTMIAGDASRATSGGERLVTAKVQSDDDILVFFEKSHQVLRYTGDDFRFPYVWKNGSSIYGGVAVNGSAAYEGAVLARSLHRLVVFSGRQAAPVDVEVPDLVKSWNPAAAAYSQGAVAPWLDQAFLTFAKKSDDLPASMVSINTLTGAIGIFEDLPFHVLGEYAQQTALTLDEIGDILDTIATRVDEWGTQPLGTPILLGGGRDSRVHILFTGTVDGETAIRGRSTSKRLSPDPEWRWRLHRIRVRADAAAGATMTLRVFRDFEPGAFLEKELSLTPAVATATKVDRFVGVNQTGTFFRIQLESNDANANAWDLVEPWFSRAGRVRNV